MTTQVYLSMGSNLGDREGNLRAAVAGMGTRLEVDAISSIYETEPVGYEAQPAFLNLALGGRTDLSPELLLDLAKELEREIGRRPTVRWGPRVVDIDLLLYGDEMVRTPRLVIPHPEMAKRAFVLVPLAEIAPEVRHPVLGRTARELLEQVQGRETVRHVREPPII